MNCMKNNIKLLITYMLSKILYKIIDVLHTIYKNVYCHL